MLSVMQFANSGPPPDVVGAYNSDDFVASIAADGFFVAQGSDSASDAFVGKYFSYE